MNDCNYLFKDEIKILLSSEVLFKATVEGLLNLSIKCDKSLEK